MIALFHRMPVAVTPAALLLIATWAVAAPTAGTDKDIAVQLRGPVHEAFAQPVEANPKATPAFPKKPPDPVPELPPDEKPKDDAAQWIPGYWDWDADKQDFIWVSGTWRVPPPK